MKVRVRKIVTAAIEKAQRGGELGPGLLPEVVLEYPREKRHGDYATNVAMVLASRERRSPREVAETILRHVDYDAGMVERVEIAGPGFINFVLSPRYWLDVLRDAGSKGDRFGDSDLGRGTRVLVEFLSANPTGPLHIGHGRIAAVGDSLSNVLGKVGFAVQREYYLNDTGTQMEMLGRSVAARYSQECGYETEFPDEGYKGDYIKNIAHDIREQKGTEFLKLPDTERIAALGGEAADVIMGWIQEDLRRFRVRFDRLFSERDLYQDRLVYRILDALRQEGYVYEEDGALWFKSTLFGDEKDRVVVRNNGATTYFASDIAYHKDKYDRGFDLLIDIWGADHHGYVSRMESAVQALGLNKDCFKVILVQLVNLWRGGGPVTMSTRSGEFTSLSEVMDEVGEDACRYFFMLRRADTPLDFDLDLARAQGAENPVYYVQYAHARIASIFKKAADNGIGLSSVVDVNVERLTLPGERALAKQVAIFPEFLESTALALEPHRLTGYLQELATLFHGYYNRHRVVSDDRELTEARLLLVRVVQSVVRNGLTLMGVSAPEEM